MDTTQLRKNFVYYREHQSALFNQYGDCFLLIYDCEVIGAFERQIDAFEAGKRDYDEGSFLVVRCTETDSEYTVRNNHTSMFWENDDVRMRTVLDAPDDSTEKVKEAMSFVRAIADEHHVELDERHYDQILWLVERECYLHTRSHAFQLFFIKGENGPESPFVHELYKNFCAEPGNMNSLLLNEGEREALRRVTLDSFEEGNARGQIHAILSGTMYDELRIGNFYPMYMNLLGKLDLSDLGTGADASRSE
jgi:hypothetical protein